MNEWLITAASVLGALVVAGASAWFGFVLSRRQLPIQFSQDREVALIEKRADLYGDYLLVCRDVHQLRRQRRWLAQLSLGEPGKHIPDYMDGVSADLARELLDDTDPEWTRLVAEVIRIRYRLDVTSTPGICDAALRLNLVALEGVNERTYDIFHKKYLSAVRAALGLPTYSTLMH